MKPAPFAVVMKIRQMLEDAGIHSEPDSYRDDAVSIRATVPGERWEIDVLEDGSVDFERFRSDGKIEDENALADIIRQFAE